MCAAPFWSATCRRTRRLSLTVPAKSTSKSGVNEARDEGEEAASDRVHDREFSKSLGDLECEFTASHCNPHSTA